MIFDREAIRAKLRDPMWCREIPPILDRLRKLHDDDRAAYESEKEALYALFEAELAAGRIAVGEDGPDQDAERLPIDVVVIHHTSNPPGLSPLRLSAIELIRLYASRAAEKERPVYSSHIRDGKQVFWPYHWIVRSDGAAGRLLEDREIGWHAGDWDMNRRSVGICLDGDYERSEPPRAVLAGAAKLIRESYPGVPKDRVFGHRETNPKTTCPSELFLGEYGWKRKLVDLI